MTPAQARKLCEEIHGGQVRKWTGEPYAQHCIRVAERLAAETRYRDGVIVAAYLHDALEDQPARFVPHVSSLQRNALDLVLEMTHQFTSEAFPTLNRAQRKAFEAMRIQSTSQPARAIKLYDALDNLSNVAEHDPKFARTYAIEVSWYLASLPPLPAKGELHDIVERLTAADALPAEG